jgi:hypothetical protein
VKKTFCDSCGTQLALEETLGSGKDVWKFIVFGRTYDMTITQDGKALDICRHCVVEGLRETVKNYDRSTVKEVAVVSDTEKLKGKLDYCSVCGGTCKYDNP